MELLNLWWIQVILYLIFCVVFTQFFKITTKTSKKDGALTVLLEVITSMVIILFIPFFEMRWPADIRTYLFTGLAVIFYCLKDRMITTVRKNLQASTVNILEQFSNIFMVVWGLLFFKEPFIWSKIIGAILIILSNVLVFYQKGKFVFNKYILLGVIANLSFSIALALNVGISEQFNIAIFEMITLLIPAILICVFEKIKVETIKEEWKQGNKKAIIITGLSWGLMILTQLRAMQLGSITTVAPLCAVSVILNVLAGYLFLKEKDHIMKKIIAAIMVIVSVILIK